MLPPSTAPPPTAPPCNENPRTPDSSPTTRLRSRTRGPICCMLSFSLLFYVWLNYVASVLLVIGMSSL